MINILPFLMLLLIVLPQSTHADTEVEPSAYNVPSQTTGMVQTEVANEELASTEFFTPVESINEAGEVVGIEYDSISHKAPCGISTCITGQMIANSNHAYVYKSPIIDYLPLIEPPEKNEDDEISCSTPHPTGMIVYRQTVSEQGIGMIEEVPDAFCLNQGCVYYARNEVEEDESGDEEDKEITPKCVYGS